MALLYDPRNISVGDLAGQALRECGAIGVGQTPLAEDMNEAIFRLQLMLQQWQNQRWLVYHLVTYGIPTNGAQIYSVGPGGAISNGVAGVAQRPDRIESAFLRQLQNSQPNQIDYPLTQLPSMEDYNRIALKSLVSFPGWFFYDPAWPLGNLFVWPVPNPIIYGIYISIKEVLPASFVNSAAMFNLPFEYYAAMLYNLAERLLPKYGMAPNPTLRAMAKNGRNVVRGSSTALATLVMPSPVLSKRRDGYNIFSDTFR